MGSITSALAALTTQTQSTATAASAQSAASPVTVSGTDSTGFGSATNVTLSAAALAVLAGQNAATGANVSSASSPPPPPPPPSQGKSAGGGHSGGGVPVTTSTSASVAELIEEAKQKVIPQVGVVGASEVIDKNGNIDYTKLNQLIAQQQNTSLYA